MSKRGSSGAQPEPKRRKVEQGDSTFDDLLEQEEAVPAINPAYLAKQNRISTIAALLKEAREARKCKDTFQFRTDVIKPTVRM